MISDSEQTDIKQTSTTNSQRFKQLLHVLKRYPLPLSALALLLVSFLLWSIGRPDLAHWVLLIVVLTGGIPLLWSTLKQLVHGTFSIDLIALLAILGSLLLGEYLAGSFIVLMLSGGEALEAFALRRARSSLSALAERAPRVAHIWQGERLVNVPAEEIAVGMIVVIKQGELIPVDGVVEKGSSSVSEADLTGEAVPVRKARGMVVFSGSVNLDGILEVRASKRSVESKYAQIVRLVAEAQEQKAPIQRLADRYSLAFTIATVLLAGAAWLFSGQSLYALAVLVVATPCPLILATPIAIMSGIDVAARYGLIVKSGSTIEQLGEIDVAVFDKTGTLTLGTPRMTAILLLQQDQVENNHQEQENALLGVVASVEQLSTHILARAIVEAAQERKLVLKPAHDFKEIFGKGVSGLVPRDGEQEDEAGSAVSSDMVAVGNRTFMRHLGISLPPSLLQERERRTAAGQICSFVALNHQCAGLVVLEDIPRAELSQLTPRLKQEGIKETILLTGDGEVVAQRIGQLAQVDHVIARCLPEEKVHVVQKLVKQGRKVLMVGDGVNDAPALASATVGMALGAHGLTAASTASDAVLLSSDILRVVTALHLGRRVLRIALQGIWIGMGLSIVAMIFAALGFIPPATGAILQEGIDVLVIFNALRVSAIKR
jgi:heavy metal translocating P-type ATPase